MPPVCSYKRIDGAWVATSALRPICNAPSVGAPNGTTIEIDCGSGTLINVTKEGRTEVPAPQFVGVEFPPGIAPPDVVELTFEANEWMSSNGDNWTSRINSAAPAGTKIIVSEAMIGQEYVVYGFKGPSV